MCVRFFSTFLQEIFDAINAERVKSRFSESVECVTYGDFHLQQLGSTVITLTHGFART
jgi:hypothetical protein